MTDKVQKIREEVGRIQLYTQSEVLKQVLDYIDEVQEEPRFKVGQTIADPTDPTFTFHINRIENGKYIESDDAWVLIKDADEEYQLVEEPVSKVWHDMIEEAENGRNIIIIDPKDFYGAVLRKGGTQLKNHNKERYVKWAYIDDIINVTNKEEPVSEELEEAAEYYSATHTEYFDSEGNPHVAPAFKAGAEWQKEQDKETIELAEDHAMLAGMVKGKEETIEKACNYLHEHREEVKTEDNGIAGWISDEFIENFRKNMEGYRS